MISPPPFGFDLVWCKQDVVYLQPLSPIIWVEFTWDCSNMTRMKLTLHDGGPFSRWPNIIKHCLKHLHIRSFCETTSIIDAHLTIFGLEPGANVWELITIFRPSQYSIWNPEQMHIVLIITSNPSQNHHHQHYKKKTNYQIKISKNWE